MPTSRPDPIPAAPALGSVAERFGALRHLPALARLVFAASPRLLPVSFALRLARASLPVVMLYLAKLILDAVVAEHGRPHPAGLGPAAWIADPDVFDRLRAANPAATRAILERFDEARDRGLWHSRRNALPADALMPEAAE